MPVCSWILPFWILLMTLYLTWTPTSYKLYVCLCGSWFKPFSFPTYTDTALLFPSRCSSWGGRREGEGGREKREQEDGCVCVCSVCLSLFFMSPSPLCHAYVLYLCVICPFSIHVSHHHVPSLYPTHVENFLFEHWAACIQLGALKLPHLVRLGNALDFPSLKTVTCL